MFITIRQFGRVYRALLKVRKIHKLGLDCWMQFDDHTAVIYKEGVEVCRLKF